MWKQRRWRQLLNILAFLPRTSAYAEALALDEELAAEVVKLPQSDRAGKWARDHREYTPEVEMLSALFDRVGELIRVVAATNGSRGGKAPPQAPRPVSALERVRVRNAHARHQQLAERLLKKPTGQ
jgi:hypothetical protein